MNREFDSTAEFRFGPWQVDPSDGRLTDGEREERLEPKLLRILELLAAADGEVLSRRALFDGVWPNQIIADQTLDSAISRLRSKLGDDPKSPIFILTVPKRGYRLLLPVVATSSGRRPNEETRSGIDLRQGDHSSAASVGEDSTGISVGSSPPARKAQAFRWLIPAMLLLALAAFVLLDFDQWRSEPAAMTASSAAATSVASPASVAVLPFVNMSEDPDTGYFSDGIAEELLNQLTRVDGLRVASRTSSFRFRGGGAQPVPDVREIGRQLEVRYVIEGSVRRGGDDLRVTVQMIDALDGFHRWSHTYEARWDDVFDLQEEMTRAIVQQVAPRLVPERITNDAGLREGSPRAYELYLLGRHYWHQRQPESLRQAADYFSQALAVQPDSVLALTGLAETYLVMVQYGGLDKSEALAKAEPLLAQALAIAPDLSESHLALGHLHFLRAEWDAAEAELSKSLALNENLAMSHMLLGNVYNESGRLDQAYSSYREALRRDPLHATVLMNLSQVSLKLGLFERARVYLARATSLFPAHTFLLGLNAHIAISSGDESGASSLLRQWHSQQEQGAASPRSSDVLACGMLSVFLQQWATAERCLTAALAGKGAEVLHGSARMLALSHLALVRAVNSADQESIDLARSAVREFERDPATFSRDEVAVYELAVAYAQLGDARSALEHLRRSIMLGRRDYGWVRHDRRLQALAELPAFTATFASLESSQAALREQALKRFPDLDDHEAAADEVKSRLRDDRESLRPPSR